ncbi:MAG: hypothetical protein U0414_41865 [Polyangiaceae bacterium]
MGLAPARPLSIVLALAALGCGDGRAEACAKSCQCGTLGQCDASPQGSACAPSKPEHCAQSSMCKLVGHCTLKAGRCVAGSDEDCERSKGCETMKTCTLEGEVCVAPPRPPPSARPKPRGMP